MGNAFAFVATFFMGAACGKKHKRRANEATGQLEPNLVVSPIAERGRGWPASIHGSPASSRGLPVSSHRSRTSSPRQPADFMAPTVTFLFSVTSVIPSIKPQNHPKPCLCARMQPNLTPGALLIRRVLRWRLEELGVSRPFAIPHMCPATTMDQDPKTTQNNRLLHGSNSWKGA